MGVTPQLNPVTGKFDLVRSLVGLRRNSEDFVGSDGSGSNGDADRVFTLSESLDVSINDVFLQGILMNLTTNYTIDNSAKTITFVNTQILDQMTVQAFYNT